MKDVAEWNTEIEKLVAVIDLVNNSSINFSSISFGNSFDYNELEDILKAMKTVIWNGKSVRTYQTCTMLTLKGMMHAQCSILWN